MNLMTRVREASTRRSVTAVLTASTLVLLATGCAADTSGGGADASSSSSASSAQASASAQPSAFTVARTMPAGKGSGESDGTFPRTVKHFQGETTLKSEPKRVVVVSTGQADVMLTLGIVPVASTSGDGAKMIPQYLTDAFPDKASQLKDAKDVGSRFDPDVETIANAKPDLIVMNNAGKDADAMYKNLSKVAPTVATQGTGLHWKEDFLLLADSVGKTQQAQSWLDDYQDDAASFGKGVKDNPTVSFLRKNGDRTRVFGVASFTGSVAEDAGLARPESQTFTDKTSVDVSSEQLEDADADWLFYGVQGGKTSELTDMSLWKTLEAVKKDHAVSVDDDVFYLNVGPTAARKVLSQLEDTLG